MNASDVDGAPQFPVGSLPTYANVACTIQGKARIDVGEQRRISQVTEYLIIFPAFIPVSPRDMITFVDGGGLNHTVFIESIEDMAGRNAAFKVWASERI